MQSAFIPIPLTLCNWHSLIPEVLVAHWIVRLNSNPEVASSNPADDDFGFRCFGLLRKFTLYQKLLYVSKAVVCIKNCCIKNCLCFTQKKIQMSDDKISSSEQPKIYRTKKAVIIVVGQKTKNQKQSLPRSSVPSNSVQMTNFSGQLKIPIRRFKIRRSPSIV